MQTEVTREHVRSLKLLLLDFYTIGGRTNKDTEAVQELMDILNFQLDMAEGADRPITAHADDLPF